MAQSVLGFLENQIDGRAIQVAFEDDRVHIALAANCRSVAEAFGDALDGRDEIFLGLGFRVEAFELSQRDRGKDGSRPGAKILGGEITSGDFTQVGVHVLRLYVLLFAVLVLVLKKFLTGKVLHAPDDFREAGIVKLDRVADAALALELKSQGASLDCDVPIAHCAEPNRAVGAGVLFVADTHQCRLEQTNHGREHFFPAEAGPPQIPGDLTTNAGESPSEGDHSLVLAVIAYTPPVVVIPVLFAVTCVAAGGLDVSIVAWANPDVGPRRGNREPLDPAKDFRVRDPTPCRITIVDASAGSDTGDS